MATIKDVAQLAGVGVGTVSRALSGNGAISEKTKKKIEEAAKKLDFVPNHLAQNFKNQLTKIIAIIVPTMFHPFFAKIAFYCEKEMAKIGYRLMIVSSQDDEEVEMNMLDMIKQQRVDGIIFITHYDHKNLDKTLPIISIDRHFDNRCPYVTSNNYEMSRKAVEYLIEKGSKNIACVCGDTLVESEVKYRDKAYIDVMQEHGLPIILFKKQFKHGQEMEVMKEFFEKYPNVDGLFAGSDMLASSAYHVATQLNMKVPEDLQIIGFDGVMKEWMPYPNISVVCQDIPEMAKEVVNVLLKRIKREKVSEIRFEVPATFIKGETTR